MAKTNYILRSFDSNEAASGMLVCMLSSSYTSATISSTADAFVGVGICEQASGGTNFFFKCKSITYVFNKSGVAYSQNAQGYMLKMARITDNISRYGSTARGTQRVTTTRTRTGEVSTSVLEGTPDTISIDSLNTRDQFALQALRGILSHIDKPNTLGDNEISMYCDAAYQWAANMMSASARVRAVFNDETETSTYPTLAEIGMLENNQEKLLNNIIVALERTDVKTLVDGNETYLEQIKLMNMAELTAKLTESNTALTALKDNVTNAMTNLLNVQTQMNGYLNNIVTQLSLINTSIQSFTLSMNTRLNTINSNITDARGEISGVQSTANTINTSVNTIKTTTNTVNTNLNTVKSDVGIIKQNTTPQ